MAMRNVFWHNSLKLFLSALVLAWGIVPPGFQHAHAEGDDSSHRHSDCHDASHHGSHHHGTEDEISEHSVIATVSLLEDSIVHFHWQFLGIEFSMPVAEEPLQNNGTTPPAFFRSIDKIAQAATAGSSMDRVFAEDVRAPNIEVVRDLEGIPRAYNLVTSIPLCDSARLERSGVRLA